jgi:hypothetical protein
VARILSVTTVVAKTHKLCKLLSENAVGVHAPDTHSPIRNVSANERQKKRGARVEDANTGHRVLGMRDGPEDGCGIPRNHIRVSSVMKCMLLRTTIMHVIAGGE